MTELESLRSQVRHVTYDLAREKNERRRFQQRVEMLEHGLGIVNSKRIKTEHHDDQDARGASTSDQKFPVSRVSSPAGITLKVRLAVSECYVWQNANS